MSKNHLNALNMRQWRKVRSDILERDGYRCTECGKAGRLEVDHVRPLNRGGAMYDDSNLQSLCRSCHIAKTRSENSVHDPRREVYNTFVNELLTK